MKSEAPATRVECRGFGENQRASECGYCSPLIATVELCAAAVLLLPHTELEPQTELLPHTELDPHTELLPQTELEPHTELLPQTELAAPTVLEPHTELVSHTELVPQTELVFQTEPAGNKNVSVPVALL